ncbi:hypothetical protein ACFWF7_43200 [Nocardia sp. NPDC060256]|uniref:hypothetical protein n=1 Tax=unclassified Nocardia TaxID=2637762 RepID=UPI00364B8E85
MSGSEFDGLIEEYWRETAAEQRSQRDAAAQALAILAPMAEALPDPAFTDADLERMATTLARLIGLTWGATEVSAADRAGALARTVYANLHDHDHRIDIAEIWYALALRHHETSFVAGCPDVDGERRRQRAAAAASASILILMAQHLPDPLFTNDDLARIASVFDRLLVLLTFGAPVPPDADALENERLAATAATLRDQIRTLIST